MVSVTNPENLFENNELNSSGHLLQVISFAVGNDIFGVDIRTVHQVIRSAQFTPVPNSPDFIVGVMNLRGNIFPVIDLRKKLHLSSGENHTDTLWIIIIEVQNSMTGFIVDKVLKAHKVHPDSVEKKPEIFEDKLDDKYICSIAHINEKRIPLLDFNQIVLG